MTFLNNPYERADETSREAFQNDVIHKLDHRIEETSNERDRWRALLCEVVGELAAERMFRDADRAPLCLTGREHCDMGGLGGASNDQRLA